MTSITRRAAVTAVAVAGLAATLAGCGSTHPAGSGTHSPVGARPSSPAATAPKSSLVITIVPHAGAAPVRWTLTCDPVGGTHPDAAAACAALSRVPDPFAPTPRGVACPMIVSGPQTATITGTWNGEVVNASFSKRNGCETGRWKKIGPVFGSIGAGGFASQAAAG